ncbi:OmpP1/FadL family transporter [Ketobacter sp.]
MNVIGPKINVPLWALVFSVLVNSFATQAALVENLTMGNAKALSLGNAVTADPPSIDSIHYNPAGLAKLKGRQLNLKVLAASMEFEVAFGGHDDKTRQILDGFEYHDEVAHRTSKTSTVGLRLPYDEGVTEWPLPVLIMPMGGASYSPPGSDVTFATAAYAPMAAGYIREGEDDPARFMGEYMSMATITYFSPSIGVQLTEHWSVGASINFSWQGVTAGTSIRVPNIALAWGELLTRRLQEQNACPAQDDPMPLANLCGLDQSLARMGPYTNATQLEFDAESGLVAGINIGALWQPNDWFTWGVVYQFERKANLDGTYRLTYHDEWVNFFGGLHQSNLGQGINFLLPFPDGQVDSPHGRGIEYGKAEIEIITPAHFSTGISLQAAPRWKLNIDVKWTDWGVWDGLSVSFDQPLDFTKLATLVSAYSELTELTIPRHYKSVWNWAFGVEYQYNDNLALRFGYEPRKSSIPDDKQDVLLPVGDAELFGFGVEYTMRNDRLLEVALGYVHAEASVPANTSTNANSSDDFNNFIYNPYAGTDFSSQMNAYLLEVSYSAPF